MSGLPQKRVRLRTQWLQTAKYFPKEFREVKQSIHEHFPELSNTEVGVETAAVVCALVSKEIISFEEPYGDERQDDIRHFMIYYFDVRMNVIFEERNFEPVFLKIADTAYSFYRRRPRAP